jgi:hypothetical protein
VADDDGGESLHGSVGRKFPRHKLGLNNALKTVGRYVKATGFAQLIMSPNPYPGG